MPKSKTRNPKPETRNPFLATAIVVAAGSSTRMGGRVRKPYLKLRGKPVLAWSLAALARLKGLRQIVLVTRPEDRARALAAAKKAGLPPLIRLDAADGGARRQDSVFNGLKATLPECGVVLIHDAARPFPERDAICLACAEAIQIGAAILACPVKDTVKRQTGRRGDGEKGRNALIESTIPRDGLWRAQTPQVFRRALILDLFERLNREAPEREVTDDAAICELFGQPVALVESGETNLKVTRPEDILLAEAYLKQRLVGS